MRQAYFDSLEPEYRKRIDGELRRIIRLRSALKNEADYSAFSLVGNLEGSMAAWRESRGEHGIDAVRKWRSGKGLPNGVTQYFPREEASEPYNPDDYVKAYFVSYKDKKHVENVQDHEAERHSHDHKILESQRKISVSRLLMQSAPEVSSNASDRPLPELSQASSGSINYLHLPANNMAVSTHSFDAQVDCPGVDSWIVGCCSCPYWLYYSQLIWIFIVG